MYCRHCGAKLDSKFCPNCGQPANENITPYQQPYVPDSENSKLPIAKQWWFWVLIVVTIIALLVTVYSLEPESKQTVVSKPAEKTATAANEATTEVAKPAKQAASFASAAPEEEDASFASAAPEEQADQITIPQTVLFDQDGIKITATALVFDDWYGPDIQFLAENNTDSTYTMQVRNVSVNGAMIYTLCSCDVEPGKKAYSTIRFDETVLEATRIDTIRQIEFNVLIFDSDSYDTLYYTDTIFLQTSAAQNVEQTFDDSGFVALDESGVRFIVRGVSQEDSTWGTDVNVYIENNSDKDVVIQVNSVSVNGYMLDTYFFCDVAAGKVAYNAISFDDDALTAIGVSSLENMEFSVGIYDYPSWDIIFESDPIQVTFS